MEAFSALLAFVRGIHRPPVDSSHKGQWRWALMFSLICAWINAWVNNIGAGDLRRHRAHYDVIVMRKCLSKSKIFPQNKTTHTRVSVICLCKQYSKQSASQIAKPLGSTWIRYRSDTFVSHRCLIDKDQGVWIYYVYRVLRKNRIKSKQFSEKKCIFIITKFSRESPHT